MKMPEIFTKMGSGDKIRQILEVTLLRKRYIGACAALLWLLSMETAPAATLRTGMSGAAVTELQQSLAEAGYFARTADGDYGSTTARAVALFQADHGLAATGAADDETVRRIRKEKDRDGRKGGGVVMTEGNRGADVAACQHRLIDEGYLKGAVDGLYGPATAAAVRAFQKAKDLPVSGIVDEKTKEALEKNASSEETLSQGDRGGAVKEAQRQLHEAGYLSGAADGVYGSQTASAVRAFQQERGLSVTGKIDKTTWKALRETPKTSSALREGDRGPRVAHLQNLLTLHGFAPGSMDGVYGRGTAAKVREFQNFCGMRATGTVDEAVWQKLRSAPVFRGEYKKVMRMQSTAYTPYDGGGTGRTASGNVAGKGHVAVDPNVIPLGSLLFIEGYGYALADDIGGGINGQTVDVGVDTLDQAYGWGNRRVNVYLVQ